MTAYNVNVAGSNTMNLPANLTVGDQLVFQHTSTGRTGTILEWTVPISGKYNLEAIGARAGISNQSKYGRGAKISADFQLEKGEIIQILVGQIGNSTSYAGGGGGTFIAKGSSYTNAEPLIVAGGGGSCGQDGSHLFSQSVSDGQIESSGADGYGASGNKGEGGTSGQGGTAGTGYCPGAGGGGFYGDGADGNGIAESGGKSFRHGGTGGKDSANGTSAYTGGFGGGAGGYDNGGAGGGYSGGGGGGMPNSSKDGSGGGGGSFWASQENLVKQKGIGTGHGKVTITFKGGRANTPTKVSSVTIPSNIAIDVITPIEWTPTTLPQQPDGVTLDDNKVYYKVELVRE